MSQTNQSAVLVAGIRSAILHAFDEIDGVVSVSLVGSFCEKMDLSAISDIDTIVVVKNLDHTIFNKLKEAIANIDVERLGLPGYQVKINDTFGPRKFNTADSLVVHLMVYDLEGHRQHVLKSPFTCLDWERTEISRSRSLREVYPVLALQPDDFFNARRGLNNYILDLEAGSLSFRYYEASETGEMNEVLAKQKLDQRHAGEYAFHIMKFLILNYAKLIYKKNEKLTGTAFEEFWKAFLPGSAKYIPFFYELQALKENRSENYPATILPTVRDFLSVYEKEISSQWNEEARQLTILRHAPTPLNDGSFLGQRRNPGLRSSENIIATEHPFQKIYSSPLLRTIQTAKSFCPGTPIIEDQRLLEIDYGTAEGLSFADLQESHPELVKGWANGEDTRFPQGENSMEVAERVKSFLNEWATGEGNDDLVVTHNVVIRVIVGELLGLPVHQWYLLDIPHMVPISLRWFRGRFYLNITASLREHLLDSVVRWPKTKTVAV